MKMMHSSCHFMLHLFYLCCIYYLSEAYDYAFMHETMSKIVQGKTVEVPSYDYITNSRYNSYSEVTVSYIFVYVLYSHYTFNP